MKITAICVCFCNCLYVCVCDVGSLKKPIISTDIYFRNKLGVVKPVTFLKCEHSVLPVSQTLKLELEMNGTQK